MGRSRYAGNRILDGDHYATWPDPTAGNPMGPDILDGVDTVEHILGSGDRLDTLAHQYFGDPDYWWVLALANRIMDPFSLVVGNRLRIPLDVRSILNKVRG